MEKYLADLIAKIAAAQENDGYLYTARTIDPENLARNAGDERWFYLIHSHELYNVAHMYETAVAYYQVFKTLDDSLIINSVSKTTRSVGNTVEDSMLRINISAAFLPISC